MADKVYPKSKDILKLLGIGALLTTAIFVPGIGISIAKFQKHQKNKEFIESQKRWKTFNIRLLRRNIKRLHQLKIVEFVNENGEQVIKLTENGKIRLLKYSLEDISLNEKVWDGKWRLILYDIEQLKKSQKEQFRRALNQIKCLQIQRSVYLTPYPCKDQINYLREVFSLREDVLLMEISKLENESVYKQYFGL